MDSGQNSSVWLLLLIKKHETIYMFSLVTYQFTRGRRWKERLTDWQTKRQSLERNKNPALRSLLYFRPLSKYHILLNYIRNVFYFFSQLIGQLAEVTFASLVLFQVSSMGYQKQVLAKLSLVHLGLGRLHCLLKETTQPWCWSY